MNRTTDTAAQRWPLRGFWRAWYWISVVIAAGFAALGTGMAVLAWWLPLPPRAILLVTAVLLLAVATTMTRQLVTTVLDASITQDGTLTLRRLGRTLHTHASRVRLVRRSAMASGPHTPTVIETADGSVLLIHPLAERDQLIAAIHRHNPGLPVRP